MVIHVSAPNGDFNNFRAWQIVFSCSSFDKFTKRIYAELQYNLGVDNINIWVEIEVKNIKRQTDIKLCYLSRTKLKKRTLGNRFCKLYWVSTVIEIEIIYISFTEMEWLIDYIWVIKFKIRVFEVESRDILWVL